MANNKKPVYRIVAKNKDTGASVKIGSVWEAPFPGAFNISFITKPYNEKEMAISEFLKVHDNYFVAMYSNDDEGAGKPKARVMRPAQDDLDF